MHSADSAQLACQHLNNQVIFADGSKMNIFSSNLRQINFQNSNLGGVDYSLLKKAGSVEEVEHENEPVRGRSQTHWAHHIFE
jgi:hypothetical protein